MFRKSIPCVTGTWSEIVTQDAALINHIQDPANHVDDIITQLGNEYLGIFSQKRYHTVLDIGANIGLFSFYLSAICEKVYAVEPTPSHFDLLRKIIGINSNITPVHAALSDQNGPVEFFISKENSTMNTLTQKLNNIYTNCITVQGWTIQHMLDELGLEKVDLVKMDIEGGESLCITDELVRAVSHRVDSWFVECHGNPVGGSWQEVLRNTVAVFDRVGYSVYHVTHDGIMAQKSDLPAPKIFQPTDISGDITIEI